MSHLAVLAAVYGAADAFFAPAFTGLLPGTVSPVNLQPANALRGLSYSAGSIVGPILAGFLVAFAGGPGGAFLFDAATFAVSIACLMPLRPRVVADVMHDEDPEANDDPLPHQSARGLVGGAEPTLGDVVPRRHGDVPRDRAASDLRPRAGARGGGAGRR